jgi:hypothetical protein
MDSEGSRRLIQAAVEAGADVLRGVPLSEGECERRSRTNRELDLKRHLHPGYHGPRWKMYTQGKRQARADGPR